MPLLERDIILEQRLADGGCDTEFCERQTNIILSAPKNDHRDLS